MAVNRQFNEATGVGHYRVTIEGSLGEFLVALGLGDPTEWLRFGAVFVDGLRHVGAAGAAARLKADQIVRLHTRPKRYPTPPLSPRVLFVGEDFVALDKPGGLPTHPTLDNVLENAAAALSAERGEPLYVTHRLDVPTDGVLLLARTKDAQRRINRLFEKRRVEKTYRATAKVAVPPGEYRHWLDPATRVPRDVATEPRDEWWACRLIVEDAIVRPDGAVEHVVRPLTGKTHQIRAQFAALGSPLIGDPTYGGVPSDVFGLTCLRLAFRLGADFDIAVER